MGRKQKKDKKVKISKIAYKLALAFMLPVAFIVVLGIVSYESSAKFIVKQYTNSLDSELGAVSSYLELLCDNVEDKATEIVVDATFSTYYAKYAGKSTPEAAEYARIVNTLLNKMRATCDYISNYQVISEKGGSISSGRFRIPENAYMEFAATEEAEGISKGVGVWSGYHSYLDETIGTTPTEYAFSYIKRLDQGNGYLFLDVEYAKFFEIVEQIGDENFISALVTQDGRVITKENEQSDFAECDFFESAKEIGVRGNKMVHYDGQEYLFFYSPIGKTGIMLCTLVPQKRILASANSIKIITFVMVFVAAVVALAIGGVLSKGIGSEVGSFVKSMERVAEGDFTADVRSKRRDEFMLLAISIRQMKGSISDIFRQIHDFTGRVNTSSAHVADTIGQMALSMEDINAAMEDIARGVANQVIDAEDCLQEMSRFSGQLNDTYLHAQSIEEDSRSTIQAVSYGKAEITGLNEKANRATETTKQLVSDITAVADSTEDIGGIIETIQSIAEQTNLLSLNASIEAARAGEAGKGFSVVADEIRKLAEESSSAADQIKYIIGNIQATTNQTVDCVYETETHLIEQSLAMNETISAFSNISSYVEKMILSLNKMTENVAGMVENKDSVLASIKNIVGLSESAAAATEEVTATINSQLDNVYILVDDAKHLSDEVKKLDTSMQHYSF